MYANILLSTDGSDVAKKGVGIALAKALNAKATVITVCERTRRGRNFPAGLGRSLQATCGQGVQ
jgi:hypothetical protein